MLRTKFVFIVWLSILALATFAVQFAAAQNDVVWSAAYFNNQFLSGDPVLQRQEIGIGYQWGTGSPDPAVNSDNFSARWGTDVFFEAGTYRFFMLADDAARINIDFAFQPLIDTFSAPQPGQVITADITLTGGTHHIQVDYREDSGDAGIFVDWQNLATNPTGPNFTIPTQPVPVNNGVWTAQYYANAGLSGTPSAIMAEEIPKHVWGTGAPLPNLPADGFSARWTSVQTLEAGRYQIAVRADDGVRVTVNGVVVIDEFHQATGQTYTFNQDFIAGTHNIMIEYFEDNGEAFIDYTLFRLDSDTIPTDVDLWTAEYWSNPALNGAPTFTQVEIGPTHNWGTSSPLATIPINNFSARWTLSTTLEGGTYQFTATADDGVRVLVDGRAVINEFHLATGQAYIVEVDLLAGQHQIVVEYFDALDIAFIDFGFNRLSDSSTVGQPAVTNAFATVNTARLNLRSAPNTSSDVLTVMERGETYPIVGRNADSTWWQLDVNGTMGWVFNALVQVTGTENVPVTNQSSGPAVTPTGFTVRADETVIIREGPGTRTAVLGQFPAGRTAELIARSFDNSWWRIRFNNVVGWVSAQFATPESSTDLNVVPVES
ncbi:MAG: hypothetical protein D6737_01855 [Chloroflexi bacterium]|nr:MAG: hypothetical protein D6737_01855 [Chloroflexota bacterium]